MHADVARSRSGRRAQQVSVLAVILLVLSVAPVGLGGPGLIRPSIPVASAQVSGGISTLSGTGQAGTVDGAANVARFSDLRDIVIGADGSTLYALEGDRIREISTVDGSVSTLTSGGLLADASHLDIDGSGVLYVSTGGSIVKIEQNGTQTTHVAGGPGEVGAFTLSPDGSTIYYLRKSDPQECPFAPSVCVPTYKLWSIPSSGGSAGDGTLLGKTGGHNRGGGADLAFGPDDQLYLIWNKTCCHAAAGGSSDGLYRWDGGDQFVKLNQTSWFRETPRLAFVPGHSSIYLACRSDDALGQRPHNECHGGWQVARRPASLSSTSGTVIGSETGFEDGAPGKLSTIAGIVASPDGSTMYIADRGNLRIRKAAIPPDPSSTAPPEATATCNIVARLIGACDASEGDPVSTRSGAFHDSFTDVSVGTRGAPLAVTRGYLSLQADREGPFGFGWSSNFGARLVFDEVEPGSVTMVTPTGTEGYWLENGGGGFEGPGWMTAALTLDTSDPDPVYEVDIHGGATMTFDDDGELLTVADPNGYVTAYDYDGSGQLTTIRDVDSNRMLTIGWDGDRIDEVTDPAGRSVHYEYDAVGDLRAVVGIDGGRWEFDYDAEHRITAMRDPFQVANAGPGVVNVYDAEGRVISQTDPEGGVTSFDYTSIPGATKVTVPGTNAGPRVRVHEYQNGRRVRVTDGHGTEAATSYRFSYDPVTGGVTEVVLESVSPERVVERNDYDRSGNLLWSEDALGRRTSFAGYNGFGLPTSVTSPDGAVTTLVYDVNGNLVSSTTVGADAVSTSTSYAYDPAKPGQVVSMTDPRGKVWSFGYDLNGYQTSVTDPLGNVATSSFDVVGRPLWSVAPVGNAPGGDPNLLRSTFDTDAWGRVTEVVDPEGGVSSTEFDELGRAESVTDADGRTTSYVRDGLGRVTSVARHDGSVLGTEFWPDGSLKAQEDADGQVSSFFYDVLGRLILKVDPAGRATQLGYRPDGSLHWRQDPGGDCGAWVGCVEFTANAAGQTTAVDFSDPVTPDVTNVAYDSAGRRTSVVTTAGTYGFGYDGLGRLTSSTGAAGTTGYGWDPAGNLVSIDYPGGGTVSRGYDDAGRWTSVTDWDDQVFTFGSDANGSVESIAFPGGAGQVDRFEHDRVGRMIGVDFERSGSSWASLEWGRSDAGQLTSMAQSGLPGDAVQGFGYDDLGRVTSAGARTYGFDDADNLSDRGGFVRQRHGVANELCYTIWGSDTGDCANPPAGATVFDYDARGNRVAKAPPAGGGTVYGYDQQNRLTDISVPTFQNGEGGFTVVEPLRVTDTRVGSGSCPTSPCGPVGPGETVTVPVAGVGGLPAAGVVGAVSAQLGLEAAAGSGPNAGVVAVYSADRATMGSALEGISATYEPGTSATTGVLAKVGASGAVKVTNFGSVPVEVTLDVTGWYGTVWAPVAGAFEASDPVRVADTSTGQPVPVSGATDVAVVGQGGVPASGVDAVAVVVTATAGTQDASLVVTSSEVSAAPAAVSVTAAAGETRSALVQVAPGADGKIRLHNTSGDPVDATVDVVGWYVASDPDGGDDAGFVAVDPAWESFGVLAADTPTDVGVAAFDSPSATEAVAVTVTVSGATTPGELTVWSGDGPVPADGVTVSYGVGAMATNTATIAYPADGTLAVVASSEVSVVMTVSGYWLDGRRDLSFTYDPDGLRQTKTSHVGTTTFGWDLASGLPLLLEAQGPEGRTRYLYGPGGTPIAQQDPDGQTLYLHADQLGSVRAVTDSATGATISTVTFDAWGTAQSTGDPTVTAFGYAGQYTDHETGLIYMRARYYDPTTGSFLTRDPIETTTREAYGYVGGNPLNATDPTGLWCVLGKNPNGSCRGADVVDDVLTYNPHTASTYYIYQNWDLLSASCQVYCDDVSTYAGLAEAVLAVSCASTGLSCAAVPIAGLVSLAASGLHSVTTCYAGIDIYCARSAGAFLVNALAAGMGNAASRSLMSCEDISWGGANLLSSLVIGNQALAVASAIDTAERPGVYERAF